MTPNSTTGAEAKEKIFLFETENSSKKKPQQS